MAIQDIRSDLFQGVGFYGALTASGQAANAPAIDTANYELGLMFALYVPVWANGTFTLTIEESDDPTMSAPNTTVVPVEKLIGTPPVASGPTNPGASPLQTIGAFSTKRFVRPVITAAVGTVDATVAVIYTQAAENLPVA